MRRKAEEALIKMGMPANIKGFRYITDIMEKYAEDDAWIYGKLTLLYEIIGVAAGTSGICVERCIRKAFEDVLTRGNLEEVKKYLTFDNPTNGNLLVVFYLRLNGERRR